MGREPDGSVTIDLMEVKTYQQPEQAYRVSGGEISGDAIGQLLSTARIIEEVFGLGGQGQRVVSAQRREVLRQQLFRECFFEGRNDSDKRFWSGKLNDLFALDTAIRLRLSLVLVGLTQAHSPRERRYTAEGRSINVVELTEEEVRRHVGGSGPPEPEVGVSVIAESLTPAPAGDTQPAREPETHERPVDASRVSSAAADVSSHGRRSEDQRREGQGQERKPDKPSEVSPDETAQIERRAMDLKRVLRGHSIPVQELDPKKAQIGPSVIRYRVRLRPGAKVASLRSRAEDIGREMASRTTPIIDNIAGENYVGIDLERPRRQVVSLRPAIDALPEPRGLQLPVAVGVTPAGEHVQLDLVQLPHLLVAGSTGSGKTVFLHSILISLTTRLPSECLDLLIIDPKATDFVLYNGLPHLRDGQVFTEPHDAIDQLRTLTGVELQHRTEALQRARCPNLSEYNAAYPESMLEPIVVVIDEYADIIAVLSRRERASFEREINRLAQRARSVGIHLVLATQRPTADIVTGLLKANMPCRVSFRLPQRVDSQTILDQSGAENLFGQGDMLLLQNDRLSRLQGYYMPPAEMANFLGRRYPGSGFVPAEDPEEEEPLDLGIDDADRANHEALVGEATGLAAGPDDGDLLDGCTMTIEVETKAEEGVEVIGSAGDVLKQSVLAAWRHVQQHATDYGVPGERLRGTGVSVHLVNIAEYREGPSAGIPFVVAMVSALTERPVRPALAMTGEVSLKGKIGAVGGVPQKVVAAYKRGRKTVILPKANEADLRDVPEGVLSGLDVNLVESVGEVINITLEKS